MQDDANVGRPKIDEWETLKKESKTQFLSCNVAWLAKESLMKVRHTCSVREYVKEFSSLMLDISNMSEEEKLFNFMSRLQPWAQTQLRRQGVKDVQGAIAAADNLVDFKCGPPSSSNSKKVPDGKKGKENSSKSGKKFEGKKKDGGNKQNSYHSYNKDKKTTGCFICEGPHRARECPKQEKVSALIAESSKRFSFTPDTIATSQCNNNREGESSKGTDVHGGES